MRLTIILMHQLVIEPKPFHWYFHFHILLFWQMVLWKGCVAVWTELFYNDSVLMQFSAQKLSAFCSWQFQPHILLCTMTHQQFWSIRKLQDCKIKTNSNFLSRIKVFTFANANVERHGFKLRVKSSEVRDLIMS